MTGPQFDLEQVRERISREAWLEVQAAVLSIQLEQAMARIAELEAGEPA